MARRHERRIGEIGVPLRIRVESSPGVAKDISNAVTLQVFLQDPQGNVSGPLSANFVSDGTDGEFQYLTGSGDLDATGKWRYWGRFISGTETKTSGEFSFWVVENG